MLVALVAAGAMAAGYALALRSSVTNDARGGANEPASEQSAQDLAEGDLPPRGPNEQVGDEVGAPIQLPSRLMDNHHAPLVLSALTRSCLNAPPVTVEVLVTAPGKPHLTKTVTRTADRVHVRLGKGHGAPEWLFTRNPVDIRRVSAQLVNHDERAIMEYDDTALRNSGTAFGWADVVGLGLDAAQLATYSNTAKERNADRLKFNLFETSKPNRGSSQVWWSEEACLPQELITPTPAGLQSSKIVALKHAVDPEVLKPAGVRYPTYTIVEAIDWLEKVHDHAGAKHGSDEDHRHGLAQAED
jgi:hypothetical protein